MRKIYLLCMVLFITIFSFAQQDEKAINILDQVSQKTKSFPSILADFSFTMENEELDIFEQNEGTIKLKGQKYSLNLPDIGMLVFSDGETVWNYMEDGNQVTISEIDESSGELMDNPSVIFSIHEKGFQSKFVSEETVENKAFYTIELFPDTDEYDVSKISISIDKAEMMIDSATLFDTDGNLYVIKILKMETEHDFADADFEFNSDNYNDIEIIDFR